MKILLSIFLCLSGGAYAAERVHVGRFQSRALWTRAGDSAQKRPAVILVPGSGANGAECMVPGSATEDGKDHALLSEFAQPFQWARVNTLALAKPGIEFFTTGRTEDYFYDLNLYRSLRWHQLVENLADAVAFVKTQPGVDPARIYVLGHSEGTHVAVDYAAQNRALAGVILLGYSGESLATTVEWQLYRRPIDEWLAPEVDTNKDQSISREEAARWPDFRWDWDDRGTNSASFAEIEAVLRADTDMREAERRLREKPLYQDGIYSRAPLYEKTAALPQAVHVFTGALDVQTRPQEARTLRESCQRIHKKNCWVDIVPGLGHGFSPPKGPRRQPFLDATIGGVDYGFQTMLYNLGASL